jgi:predicted nuclease with TOPRIM domain
MLVWLDQLAAMTVQLAQAQQELEQSRHQTAELDRLWRAQQAEVEKVRTQWEQEQERQRQADEDKLQQAQQQVCFLKNHHTLHHQPIHLW